MRGSSHRSLALLFAIGHRGVFSLAGWSPRIRTHLHVLSPTQDPATPPYHSPTGLSPPAAGGSTPFGSVLGSMLRSYNPGGLPPRFGLVRVRSPLLTESRFLSLPAGNEMFQFPALARGLPDQSSFDSSPGLIAVFHALSPLGAQTSPTRPYELGRTAQPPPPACVSKRRPGPRGTAGLLPSLTIYFAHPPINSSKARV